MKTLCKKYCNYYKEGKENQEGCVPIKVAKNMAFFFFPSEVYCFKDAYPELKKIFCQICDYYKEDCDFHNKENPGPPCGGYIYFEHLLSKGLINIDEIERICKVK